MVVLVQVTLFMYLTAKFIKWSAGWNMSLVASVLEEEGEDGEEGVYGSNALSLLAWYRKGHEKGDVWMMLVVLILALAKRMPCLYSKCSLSSSGNGVLYTCVYVASLILRAKLTASATSSTPHGFTLIAPLKEIATKLRNHKHARAWQQSDIV
ncbi:hypothetical protein Bca101_076299 [Brassica carinata]